MQKWIVLFTLVGWGSVSAIRAEETFTEAARTWTNNQGRMVQAIFAGEEKEQVLLKLATGQVAKVPTATLSKADQDYLAFARRRVADTPASFPAPVEIKPHKNFYERPAVRADTSPNAAWMVPRGWGVSNL